MERYQAIKPWCELVLGQGMPLALKGDSLGVSLLFPMEKLFESYVTRALRKQMASGFMLHAQPRQYSLAKHDGHPMFQLKPDLVVRDTKGSAVTVLDCKWKRVDQAQRDRKYNIPQSDMYQMLAYGCTYLQGKGEMYLVYPRWEQFQAALPAFELPQSLRMHVVPFDLNSDKLLLGQSPAFLQAITTAMPN